MGDMAKSPFLVVIIVIPVPQLESYLKNHHRYKPEILCTS